MNTVVSRLDDKRKGAIIVVMQRVHVDAGWAHRRTRVTYQTVQLVLNQVWRDPEVAFGYGARHPHATARPLCFVQR